MNVIDFRTGRPLGAPAPFVPHFEIIEEPCRRRQAPTDLVGITAIVSRQAAFHMAIAASSEIGVSAALRSTVVSGIRPGVAAEPSEAPPFSIHVQPEPSVSEDAWLFSAELTRQSIGRLARLAVDAGAFEQRLAS